MSSALFADGSEEAGDLPRWVLVAFAARCAKRLRPVCEELAPDCPQDVLAGYDEYVRAIEQAAATAHSAPEWPPSRTAIDWNDRPESLTNISSVLVYAAGAYGFASRLSEVEHTVEEDKSRMQAMLQETVAEVLRYFKVAARGSGNASSLIRGMRRDLQLLKRAAAIESWTDTTPVLPDFFGPL
jgi:hypothetical protein